MPPAIYELWESLLQNCQTLINQPIYLIFAIAIMSIASYTDIKEMKIYNNFNFAALMLRFPLALLIPIKTTDIIGAVVIFVAMLIVGMINIKNNIGGDIKYSGVFALWVGPWVACVSFLISCIIMFPIGLVKKKAIPLAPYLELSFIIIILAYMIFS